MLGAIPIPDLAAQIMALTETPDGGQMAALVEALGQDGRHRLAEAIRDADRSSSNEPRILDQVRATIDAVGLKDVSWVVFTAGEWDDGWYVSHHAVAYDQSGNGEPLDVDVEQLLTDEFGKVGRSFAYAVNPVTGATDSDDYATEVFQAIGFPQS